MKRSIIFSAIAITILLAGIIAALTLNSIPVNNGENTQKPFYVGVTYCGNATAEAKLLIDKVKDYTNLFVLQSGSLQRNATAMDEIGDYAVSAGLNYLVYSGTDNASQWGWWLDAAQQRWGTKFLGLYYDDEPGGKMLDSHVDLVAGPLGNATKIAGGWLSVLNDDYGITYFPDGRIRVIQSDSTPSEADGAPSGGNITTYYPDGTVTLQVVGGDLYTPENGSSVISQLKPYTDFLLSYDDIAEQFVATTHSNLEWLSNQSVTVLTSDYALYWWDYLSGYDLLLAQFGWNHTTAQDIALVRGAANMQGKNWGAIITWTYNQDPYLANGDEIYNQMHMAYESGTQYVIIFNYAEDMTGPYGTLKQQHFQALERFWNEAVQNTTVVHGGIQADTVLVLPKNYGWGMRNPEDTIWGLWRPDAKSQQVWTQLQSTLETRGLRLDIVYEDPKYPVAGKYEQIYYWNQTG